RPQELSADHIAEPLMVRLAVHDELVERLRSVEGDVLAAVPQRIHVESASAEARIDALQMLGGADDDRRIVCAETLPHELAHAVDERRWTVVKVNGVAEERFALGVRDLLDAHRSQSMHETRRFA